MILYLTEQVAFKLFGCLPGYVGLRGTVEPYGDADDTVNVFFEPPVLSLLGLVLRIGKHMDGWTPCMAAQGRTGPR